MFPIIALTLAAGLVGPAFSKDDPSKPVIAVEVKTTTPTVKKGEHPKFMIEVVNRHNRDVTLVKPGDGSEAGWRTPVVKWLLEDCKPIGVARCGNVNPHRQEEV